MDKFPKLRATLEAEFGSIYKFCKESGLPAGTVKNFIAGRYGPRAQLNAMLRIQRALASLRPHIDLPKAFAVMQPPSVSHAIGIVGGRRMRVVTSVITELEDLGPAEEV